MSSQPSHIHLQRDSGLALEWPDGTKHFIPVSLLRKMSPSAEAKQLRQEMQTNRLAILPASAVASGPLRAERVELIGNYAVRILFSDGHSTGLYSWSYLYSLGDMARESDGGSP